MSIHCGDDGSCPFLYSCHNSTKCLHDTIFPLTIYEYCIFSIFPICSAICNLSGNSFGEFKVLLLMDLLNYQQNQATVLAYPLITGTALFNFIDLIFKRHPHKNTSLIDYNIVLIIIPNILFGSTLGSLVNKFIPPVVADAIIIPIMAGFSVKFYFRWRGLKKQLEESLSGQNVKKNHQQKLETPAILDRSQKILNKTNLIQKQLQLSPKKQTQSLQIQLTQNQKELSKLLKYESGHHLYHVLATIGIFLVFQTLSFLCQGKIIYFSICSNYYKIGISCLTVVFLAFDFAMFKYTNHRVSYYKKIGFEYLPKINIPKYYLMICVGAFIGGFNSGVFGIGNSTTVIFTLLFLDLEPAIVSATVGYQIVFAGSASLIQASLTKQIAGNAALLFFLQTFIIGGTLSFFLKKFVSRFNILKVNSILILVVFVLVTTSVFALIASVVLGYLQFGASNMQSVPFHC